MCAVSFPHAATRSRYAGEATAGEADLIHAPQEEVGVTRLVHRVPRQVHLELRVGDEVREREKVRSTSHLRRADQVQDGSRAPGAGMNHAEEVDHLLVRRLHAQALLLSGWNAA